MQEPKYDFRDGRIFNSATSEPIPLDEPVFVLRARDLHAYGALGAYRRGLPDGEHKAAVSERVLDFVAFRFAHPDRLKEPDTARATAPTLADLQDARPPVVISMPVAPFPRPDDPGFRERIGPGAPRGAR